MTGPRGPECYTLRSEVAMAGRYSYSNSPYQADELAIYQYQQQMYAMQSGPRRFISAVGRFFYRLIVLTLIIGAVGGVLFALYRNDVLIKIARGAGLEAQYKSLEKAIPASWGPPRSIDVPADSAAAAAAPTTNDDGSSKGDTVQTAAASEPKAKTRDGLEIVSFDSLPTVTKKGATVTASPSEPPAAAPVAPVKASRPEPVKVARAEPAPVRQQPKREKKKAEPAKPTELTRSIPLPKAKPEPEPEPVAKAEPKPEPPPKPAPEEDHTKARSSDNPLKAAIRASMAAKKSD